MHFANIEQTYLLIVGIAVALLCFLRHSATQKRLKIFADQQLYSVLCPDISKIKRNNLYFSISAVVITLCLTIALLRPQWGFTWKESHRKGVDIVVAVDVSHSMLARDVAPTRLERARREILDLLDHLKGDRVALVAFAGVAFLQTPLTVDYGTFRIFLETLTPDLIPIQGTNLQMALQKSIDSITHKAEQVSSNRERAIIMFTDGESLSGNLETIRTQAKKHSIRIYIVGIGTEAGSPVALPGGGYKKDKSGKVVISRLNQDVLQQLAQATGGIYVKSITSDKDTEIIYDSGIKKALTASTIEGAKAKRWNEYFQLPLALAIVFMLALPLVDFFSLAKRWIERTKRIERSSFMKQSQNVKAPTQPLTILAFCFLFFSVPTAKAQRAEVLGKTASEAFEQGAFDQALDEFNSANTSKPSDPRFSIGVGASHYRLKDFEKAQAAFFEAAKTSPENVSKSNALYNAGNALVQLDSLEDAIKTYEEALKLTPEDKEVQQNLAYAKKLLEQKNQKEDENEQKPDDNNQESESQNKDNSESSEKQDEKQQSEQQDQQSEQNSSEEQSSNESEEQKQQPTDTDDNSSQEEQEPQSESEKPQGSEQSENSTESQNDGSHDVSHDVSHDQLESLLGNIEENREAHLKYLKKKALHELSISQEEMPDKDW